MAEDIRSPWCSLKHYHTYTLHFYVKQKNLTAIATAISDSVTVSIGEDTNGAFNVIFFVSCADRSCVTRTPEA